MNETTLTNRHLVKRDVWVGLIIICFGILLYSQITTPEAIHRTLPEFVFSFVILLGVLITFSAFRGKDLPDLKSLKISLWEIAYFAVILLGLFAIESIGFYTTSAILVFILFLMASRAYDKNTLIKALVYSVILTLFVYFIFDIALGISLPKGILI